MSNEGVAFQYLLEGPASDVQHITAEQTTSHLPAGAKGWLHPHAKAQTGWANAQPSYEEYYQQGVAAGTPSPLGEGWSFPALFAVSGHWLLLTEASMGRSYCGTHLAHLAPMGWPLPRSPSAPPPRRPCCPKAACRGVRPGALSWWARRWPSWSGRRSPPTSAPPPYPAPLPAAPGKAAWSWALRGDGQTTYEVQRRFVDYAARMGWGYCLVDALWDTQIGYAKMAKLVQYARAKNVRILVWYNSNGHWNKAPQTPSGVLFNAASRRQEFARLRQMGIAGVKIDFFGGDGQSFMNYYQDLLEEAARAGLLVNLHDGR